MILFVFTLSAFTSLGLIFANKNDWFMQMIGCLFLLVNIFLTYDVINRNIQSREIEQLKAIRLELVELNKNIKELKK